MPPLPHNWSIGPTGSMLTLSCSSTRRSSESNSLLLLSLKYLELVASVACFGGIFVSIGQFPTVNGAISGLLPWLKVVNMNP